MTTTRGQLTVETELHLFTHSLRNLHEPATCGTYLVGCVVAICNLRKEVTKTRPMAKHHAFFNLVVSFLTAPRTSADISLLMSRLDTCRCPVSQPLTDQLHEAGTSRIAQYNSSPGVTLMFLLFTLSALVLRETNKKRAAKGDNKYWPESISNVIPFGFDGLVDAVGQWGLILPTPAPLMFLGDALDLCGRPLFIAVTTSPTFLDRFISSFRITCARLRNPRSTDTFATPPALYILGVVTFRIIAERSSQNSITIWTQGRELELYKILSDACTICHDPRLSPLDSEPGRTDMGAAVNIFHAFAFHFSKDVERPPGLHPALAPASGSTPEEPLSALYSTFHIRAPECYAPGCRRSFQEVGQAFRSCGACRWVTYCSRECQLADWAAAGFPHKVVCKQLQIFNKAGGNLILDKWDKQAFLKVFDHDTGDPVVLPLQAWFKARDEQREIEDLQAHVATRNAQTGGVEDDDTLEEVE
ncbi:hypothetical protein B0H11DRAFT_1807323 [Mycena galericulata]|nr:hypothetical protein B0H11DRAFT_1807323 [Mycena galericulata]